MSRVLAVFGVFLLIVSIVCYVAGGSWIQWGGWAFAAAVNFALSEHAQRSCMDDARMDGIRDVINFLREREAESVATNEDGTFSANEQIRVSQDVPDWTRESASSIARKKFDS